MMGAVSTQKSRRGYQKHGDNYCQRLLKQRGIDAIDGRTPPGRGAKAWRAYALQQRGGKGCPVDIKEKIEAGTFYLWRALCLRSHIVMDARKRGTPINRRTGRLPAVNVQHDTVMEQWHRINDELELDEGLDLARRIMFEQRANEEARANGGANK